MFYTTKTCPKCGKTLSLDHFYMNSRAVDGRSCYCKECHRKVQKPSRKSPLMKKCSVCGKVFHSSKFYQVTTTADGLSHDCRECRRSYVRTRRKALKNGSWNKKNLVTANKPFPMERLKEMVDCLSTPIQEYEEAFTQAIEDPCTGKSLWDLNQMKQNRDRAKEFLNVVKAFFPEVKET